MKDSTSETHQPTPPMTPAEEALQHIVEGFQHFKDHVFPTQQPLFQKLANQQNPRAMVITCADSRIVPELITQCAPGDLFVTRNVGNIVPPYGQMMGGVSTAIEYAVLVLKVQHIIICGHSDCGAMKAVLNPASLEKMPTVKAWLNHADTAKAMVREQCGCADHPHLGLLTEENVISQLDHLRTHPSVASKIATGQLFIHGWVYDIEHGEIQAYDNQQHRFRPLLSATLPTATPQARYRRPDHEPTQTDRV